MKNLKISGIVRCSIHNMQSIRVNAQVDTFRYCKALNDDDHLYHFRHEFYSIAQLALAPDQDYSQISKAISEWEEKNIGDYFEMVDSHGYDPFDPANEWRFK